VLLSTHFWQVQYGCKPADIKKSYRRLALQFHPDKNPDTEELFKVTAHCPSLQQPYPFQHIFTTPETAITPKLDHHSIVPDFDR
jgi:hypothetical protein